MNFISSPTDESNPEMIYAEYLYRGIKTNHSDSYFILLRHLWEMEFYSLVPNDDNREQDGLQLRNECFPDCDIYLFGPCRVLEVLIGISRKMEFELRGSNFNKSSTELFWELLRNLGLLYFDNHESVIYDRDYQIHKIVLDWVDRKYDETGLGGIFPLSDWKKGDKPQYEVELWYQMMNYLMENYLIL